MTKALTIWQPWASLIAAGLKEYETRSWATKHRGALAIHAAKRWTWAERDFANLLAARYPNEMRGVPPALPTGAVLGIARLIDCVPAGELRLPDFERAVGDFAPGRFAWRLEIVEVFAEPVPVRGRQGLWNWEGKL